MHIYLFKVRYTISYTNGQTKWVNQEIEQYLQLFINQCQDNWFEWISLAEFAYSNQIHASTQTTPSSLRIANTQELIWETWLEALGEFTTHMDQATQKAWSALSKVADDMGHFYHHQAAPVNKPGDKVWLNAQNITTTHPMKKLDHKWLGPYTINKVVSFSAYGLQLLASFGHTHLVFSIVLLQPYHQDPIPEQKTLPPPTLIICDGSQEYEVEKILDSWLFRGKLGYLVCWKGYGAADDLWIPERDISGARWLVTECQDGVSGQRDIGFNLCVAPFPNV